MSSKSMTPLCPKCGKYPYKIVPHDCSAKEPLESSPLESVVPVTPDILAELRARAMKSMNQAIGISERADSVAFNHFAAHERGVAKAFAICIQLIDELTEQNKDTAQDSDDE